MAIRIVRFEVSGNAEGCKEMGDKVLEDWNDDLSPSNFTTAHFLQFPAGKQSFISL